MRKKCVLRAKPVFATLAILFIATGIQWSNSALSAQSPDPLTLPRLTFADLKYMGAFRLPRSAEGGDDFSYGGLHLAYNPARNSLFGSSLHHNVAEVTIPVPVNTNDLNQLPFASYLQGFSDPTDGNLSDVMNGLNPAVLSGLVVHNNRLYGTGSIYYDAMNDQLVSHFSHSTTLSEQSYVGMSQVWETGKSGYVAGYMANIPAEWQSRLGGPLLTGQCCIPIAGRTSFGPSAFGFDPAGLGRNTALPAAPLLYYPADHTTLGSWEGSNTVYGGTTLMGGAAVIAGTRTVLFIGRNGLGAFCYGLGTSDPALHLAPGPDGVSYCYDPTSVEKSMHAYPYRYQIWAYDLADFAAVKAGSKQPWDVVPYGVWPFDLPIPELSVRIGGVAYDSQRQMLYISQIRADHDGYMQRPIIHALKMNAPLTASQLPTTVSITPDVAAPQPPGASIRFSAGVTGVAPYEYRWTALSNGVWSVLREWSPMPTIDWRPAAAAIDGRVAVSIRVAGSSAVAATAEYAFAIADANSAATAVPPSSASLASSLVAPQPTGSNIVWTATATGGTGSMLYKWFINDGSWKPATSWSTSNQFIWRPTVANANYQVSVWVKRATKGLDEADVTAGQTFAITDGAPAPTSVKVDSVRMAANLASPQPAGSTIVWTATTTGGVGPMVYKWLVHDGSSLWKSMSNWNASNQFSWTPTSANANYRVSVWVKRAASTDNEFDASTEQPFPVGQGAPGYVPPPTPTEPASAPLSPTSPTSPAPTSGRVASLALTTPAVAPQPAGSAIVWTATATGGSGPFVYKWFVFDGGLWQPMGAWTSSNQFTWTPTAANVNYRVSAWVKRAANTADEVEASAERPFAITAATSGSTTAPAPAPSSLTGSTSTRVSSLALTANLPAPQPASSTIVWTATASGGTGALIYKWFVFDGGLWQPMGAWTSSNQFTWTPKVANSNYRVSAWVKRAANTAEEIEASTERPFAITAATSTPSVPAPTAPSAPAPVTTSARVVSVALTTNLPAPQPAKSAIIWTATPAGGSGALLYKWFVFDGGLWQPVGSWTASNQFAWTPTTANANYRVSAWVKRASHTPDEAEASSERPFAITAPLSAPVSAPQPAPTPAPTPAPVTSAAVSSVSLTASLPAPQPVKSTIVWTATAAGGTGALIYKWFVFEDALWKPMGAWTSANQFTWTPASASTNYRVSVWVKRASNTADEIEASTERPFAITAATTTPATTTPAPTAPSTSALVASVALTTNLPAPQRVGSTIVWTATPTGGSGALVYKWFVWDSGWKPVGSWTASNQFSWTPSRASANYRVSVWVKRAAVTADEADATTERPFSITP